MLSNSVSITCARGGGTAGRSCRRPAILASGAARAAVSAVRHAAGTAAVGDPPNRDHDPNPCGACGHGCSPAAPCLEGVCGLLPGSSSLATSPCGHGVTCQSGG